MRVAFFGGTFDPIHSAHLRVAAAAAKTFSLDRILFAPVGNQPLKVEGPVAPYADRLELVRLAIESEKGWAGVFLASTLDAPRPDGAPNFTVDTLATLASQYPKAALFVLSGADSFLDLRRWRNPDRLLELAEWIVVSRPEFPLTEEQLSGLQITPAQRSRVHLLTGLSEEISATDLRRRLRAGDPCAGVLAPAVVDYIRSHHLYR